MKKVIDIEERIPSMREKRRRRTNRKFIFVITIFTLALLVILYFQSPLSRIDKITVNGTGLYEKPAYLEEAGLSVDKPLWGFKVKNAEKNLQKMDSIQEVSIKRKWLRDVEINIKEWDPIAYIEEDGQYRLLLENGKIFSQNHLLPEEDAPILNGFTDSEHTKRMTAQLMKMEHGVYQLISEIIYKGTADDANNITVYMDDGYEIKAIISTFAEKMAYYSEITAQLHNHEKGVIDMEVGTYFTPFSEIYGQGKEEVDEEVE